MAMMMFDVVVVDPCHLQGACPRRPAGAV